MQNVTVGLYGAEKIWFRRRERKRAWGREKRWKWVTVTKKNKSEIIKMVFPIWTPPPGEYTGNQLPPC